MRKFPNGIEYFVRYFLSLAVLSDIDLEVTAGLSPPSADPPCA